MKTALLLLLVGWTTANACELVEYAEAKDWPTARLEKMYCSDFHESLDRAIAGIENGGVYDRVALRRCDDQAALYKRLLEARGRDLPSCKK